MSLFPWRSSVLSEFQQFLNDYGSVNPGATDADAAEAWRVYRSRGGSSAINLKRLILDLERRIQALERKP